MSATVYSDMWKKLKDSAAAEVRYGNCCVLAFSGESDVIWEECENDYQGHANILIWTPEGKFVHYEWVYGSCSGCDDWEERDLSTEQIADEMKKTAAWFDTAEKMAAYLRLEHRDAEYPVSNPQSGSLPGMLRLMSNERIRSFSDMGNAFMIWRSRNPAIL